jgi:hypothetical protein
MSKEYNFVIGDTVKASNFEGRYLGVIVGFERDGKLIEDFNSGDTPFIRIAAKNSIFETTTLHYSQLETVVKDTKPLNLSGFKA